MAKRLLITVRNESVRAYLNGRKELLILGITIRIQHAHSNQFQVILPDGSEIFRIIDRGNRKLSVLTI